MRNKKAVIFGVCLATGGLAVWFFKKLKDHVIQDLEAWTPFDFALDDVDFDYEDEE